MAGAIVAYFVATPEVGLDELLIFVTPAALAAIALVVIPFTEKATTYLGTQIFAVVCFLVATAGSRDHPAVQMLMLCAFLVELIVFEPYPTNLFSTLALTILATLLRSGPSVAAEEPRILDLANQVSFTLPALLVSVFGSLMTKHREFVVDLTENSEQLMESVVMLTRANTAYQDYAIMARERAAESERQRITRDIHDIVGYTLTNNMMLMEAAMDLMKENALALPGIIETARKNAEEGLEQVRFAMYQLREQQTSYPIGLNAITRLTKTFEQATSIRIHTDYGNMPLMISDEIDSAVYHLVQESLVNSFRHGRATDVHVQLWRSAEEINVRVRDNGVGATDFVEGIGLSGMRERIEKIGGSVSASRIDDGFLVAASVPVIAPDDADAGETPS
jgi:signal transduction histidine kinase